MKLRTRIDGTDGDYMLVMDGDGDVSGYEQLEHDAAYVNALFKAMDDLPFGAAAWRCLRDRADSILIEWGLDAKGAK